MTIYKPKTTDKNVEKVVPPSPEVVTEDVPLADGKKKIDELSARLVVITAARRRRKNKLMLLALMLVLCFIIIAATTGVCLYKYLLKRPFYGFCGVGYHEGSISGQFEEQVEIDKAYGTYEKLQVPPVLDARRSTIVHDFEKNLTAIVDRDHARCYVMDLNRTVIQPPRNFFDLLSKFQSGYYIPDAEVVRETYYMVTPQVENMEPFGVYIWNECQYFETYRLVHEGQPFAMSKKRSVREPAASKTFNLGHSGRRVWFVEIHNQG